MTNGPKYVKRFIDSGFSCRKEIPKTKKVTLQQFIELYSGPEVVLHFKYAQVLNLVYVCFTHGLALPLLFPITYLGILNVYICEKIMFAYFYRQPPLFDNCLNNRALEILQYAPVMMLLAGYWQLGNP